MGKVKKEEILPFPEDTVDGMINFLLDLCENNELRDELMEFFNNAIRKFGEIRLLAGIGTSEETVSEQNKDVIISGYVLRLENAIDDDESVHYFLRVVNTKIIEISPLDNVESTPSSVLH